MRRDLNSRSHAVYGCSDLSFFHHLRRTAMPSNHVPPAIKLPQNIPISVGGPLRGRGRSGSIVKVEQVADRNMDELDQSAYVNINANWVNAKGKNKQICLWFPAAF